jgi:cellulose synthase operon protein C
VVAKASALRDFYPDYVGGGSAYELLAKVYLDKNDKNAAIRELEAYRDHGGDGVEPLKKLASLEQEAGKAEQARATWKKLNYIYPGDEQIHRSYGELLLSSGDAGAAVREYQAMVSLKPVNTAEAHYDLAKALRAAHRNGEAKDEVLTALEAAPGFKPAQQLLLQLSQE